MKTKVMQSVTLHARVIRVDGRVEELGVVSYWHRSALNRALWKIVQRIRGRKPGRIVKAES